MVAVPLDFAPVSLAAFDPAGPDLLWAAAAFSFAGASLWPMLAS